MSPKRRVSRGQYISIHQVAHLSFLGRKTQGSMNLRSGMGRASRLVTPSFMFTRMGRGKSVIITRL